MILGGSGSAIGNQEAKAALGRRINFGMNLHKLKHVLFGQQLISTFAGWSFNTK